jgi:partner of Y14 and mago
MQANSTPAASAATNSGIITNSETGERHIPSSIRADGTKRKEIRIRPGYLPPEDVEVYKNRTAQAWKTRGTGGVPGSGGLKEDDDSPKDAAKTNKNAKRREARKKAKANTEGTTKIENPTMTEAKSEQESGPKEDEEQIEKEKKARKLKKKLREAKELQEKKEKGETLLHEQFEKVIRIQELIRDLGKLGFDANGEPKEANDK